MISALTATLIGAGGSVVGGIAGGWFAILAARGQWRRPRAERPAITGGLHLHFGDLPADQQAAVIRQALGGRN